MSAAQIDHTALRTMTTDYTETCTALETKYARWEELAILES
jgi:hypothetical protein